MRSAVPPREVRADLEHTRPRWRLLPGDELISGYLLAQHLDRWMADHPGWTIFHSGDF